MLEKYFYFSGFFNKRSIAPTTVSTFMEDVWYFATKPLKRFQLFEDDFVDIPVCAATKGIAIERYDAWLENNLDIGVGDEILDSFIECLFPDLDFDQPETTEEMIEMILFEYEAMRHGSDGKTLR